jgi:DNA-binding transcriptional ArsR family regulator
VASADLLLHPVRLRIVKAFLGDRALTTRQLAAELPDVPAASVYRHVGRLTEAGVLHVVAERRVRGITERTYSLRLFAAQLQSAEVAAMSPQEHASAFLAYVAGLLGDFDRYLAAEQEDPGRSGAGYRVAAMWLTDAELADYQRELVAISQPGLAHGPGEGRRRRMLYTVLLPAPEDPGTSASTATSPDSPAPRRPRTRKKKEDQ